MQLSSFDYQPRTRIVAGPGSVDRVGELALEIGAKRILLVTDAGLVAAGHAVHVQKDLESAGLEVTLFDRSRENPTTKCVDDCVAVAQEAGVDTIVGLGGGSSMDTAKGSNFVLTNGGRMQDYWGVGKATKPMLPLIAIPTTAGTGSECQCAALIADEETHQKMACLDPKVAARIAILDPLLTLSQPPGVTACTGADAIAHAVETAVTTKRNPLSLMFSHQAFKLCISAFPGVLLNPDDLEARGKMQMGAALAGAAIENSMLGAAHAAANPLTARFEVIHGHAVALMLPHVVRFNATDPAARAAYADLAVAAGLVGAAEPVETAVEVLSQRLQDVLSLTGLALNLNDVGVSEEDIPALAEEAQKQWTAGFNPRTVRQEDFAQLYLAALNHAESAAPDYASVTAGGRSNREN